MLVVTCLLVAERDTIHGRGQWAPDFAPFLPWADSIRSHGHTPVLLADNLPANLPTWVEHVSVAPGGNPYFHRWTVAAEFLDSLDADESVWCTDGTDVVMLHDPEMEPGVLYCGSEDGQRAEAWHWMDRHHRSSPARKWIRENRGRPILNPGTLGGPAGRVRKIAEHLPTLQRDGDDSDMVAFGWLMQQQENWKTGLPVHTEFFAFDHNHPYAWLAHK